MPTQKGRGCFVTVGPCGDLDVEVAGAAAAVLMEAGWGQEIGWHGR